MKTPGQNLVQLSSAFAVLALNLFIIQSTKAGIWTETGAMTTTRVYHTATLLPNGEVLVAGGYPGGISYLASAELYDPATGTWTATASLAHARGSHTATLLPNGKVLIAGGYGNSGYLSSAELYDPRTGTWTNTGALTAVRAYHTATLLANGKVLVAGGYTNSNGGHYLSSAELYDPAAGTWTATGAMTIARDNHTATLLPNGKVLIAGGYGNSGYLSSAELYDPRTGTWTNTGALTTAHDYHTATLLPNDKVLVAGGAGNSGNSISTTELYDPTMGTWTATGALTTIRVAHTASLQPNGKVLVAGGNSTDGSIALFSAELYDPATGRWTATDAMITGHSQHTATLLPNGKVLIAGGFGSGGIVYLSSAELYDWSIWTITTTQSPINAGLTTGSGGYTNGSSGAVSATAAAGYYFVEWTENGNFVSGSSDYNFVISDNRVLVANFSADAIPPTVSISYPASAKTYTNAQTVTIMATASDNVGVTSVEFYDGGTLKGADMTAPYTYDWSFTAADNGTHTWTARAYDAARNVSTSSRVTLTVSIDITPPTVAISKPTNGANLTTSSTTVSGTASDPGSSASGVAAVEVRLNGGSWANATGTASWTRSVALSPCSNTIEARSRDKAGNYSTIASNFVTYTPPNTAPNTPANVSPPNGAAGVPITPTLEASAFSDPDPACLGDIHAASQWQVLSAGGRIVADSGTDTVNKVSWVLPTNKLYYGSNYQWHVRYRDSRNAWSSYSTQTHFTNGGPFLSASVRGTNMVLQWPTNSLAFALQWSTSVGTANWSNAIPAPLIVSGQYTVTNNIANRMRLYRLKK